MAECRIESDGHDMFVVFDGKRIAKPAWAVIQADPPTSASSYLLS
jgi:hypothetical protein